MCYYFLFIHRSFGVIADENEGTFGIVNVTFPSVGLKFPIMGCSKDEKQKFNQLKTPSFCDVVRERKILLFFEAVLVVAQYEKQRDMQ